MATDDDAADGHISGNYCICERGGTLGPPSPKTSREEDNHRRSDVDLAVAGGDVTGFAYALGWLKDEAVWLDMLKKRNIAIHVYDEGQAQIVTALIFSHCLPPLRELCEELRLRLME